MSPPDPGAVERPAVASECNECNEALDWVRGSLTAARRLALVAENALANGDLCRARVALRDLTGGLPAAVITAEGSTPSPASRPYVRIHD